MKSIFIIISIFIQVYCITIINCDGVFKFNREDDDIKLMELDSLCPNNRTKCRSTETCCKTKHNSYHCCRYKNAVCCPDKFHCCPNGSTCDTEKKRCKRNLVSMEQTDTMEWKIEDNSVDKKLDFSKSMFTFNNIEKEPLGLESMCPNNKTQCKDTKTCCITKHGNYYCCPHKNAVCCSDKWSCCPEGTTCDVKNKKCLNTTIKSDFIRPSIPRASKLSPGYKIGLLESFLSLFFKMNEQCKDSTVACAIDGKCCGQSGCCDLKDGVCCPNHSTCCPANSVCNEKGDTCIFKVSNGVPVAESKIPKTDICPDGKSECYSWQTCCLIGDNSYGCCPKRNATCCADKATCCPHNLKCDLIKHQCTHISDVKVFDIKPKKLLTRKPLMIFLNKIGLETVCPDSGKCKNNSTCCTISKDRYGCCGYESGVCCPDLTTCCPSGFTCSGEGCHEI